MNSLIRLLDTRLRVPAGVLDMDESTKVTIDRFDWQNYRKATVLALTELSRHPHLGLALNS